MAKKVTGAEWQKSTGQKAIGLTLPEADRDALHAVFGAAGAPSKAEFCRRVVRWAVRKCGSAKGLAEIREILENVH